MDLAEKLLIIRSLKDPTVYRSKAVAYAYLTFFGALGAHLLYLGKLGRWILQMFLSSCAVLVLFDPVPDRVVHSLFFIALTTLSLGYDWLTLWWQVQRVNNERQLKRNNNVKNHV